MGTGSSVEKKPQCPYHRLCAAEIRKARNARYIDGEASEFYRHCANGDTDQVRNILEAPDRQSIDELVKLERNGNTALHVAAEKGHVEIVKLLLEHECSRIILNRSGKVAAEEATTPDVKKLFIRSETSDRFHANDTDKTIAHYLPKDNETDTSNNKSETTNNKSDTTNNKSDTTNNPTLEFFQRFETKEDVHEHSLNHQTMAMWLRFYNWFSRTFPRFFQRDNLNLDSFKLHKNEDFKYFLQEKLGEKYQKTLEQFEKAKDENSIKPLLTIYSSEKYGFYGSLNRQLADSATEPDTSPHLCDRFIIEFHIRSDELEKRSFRGIVYRGATMKSSEISSYEKVCENTPRGVIAFKAFTSTSEDRDTALQFIVDHPPKEYEVGVLFIIEIKTKSPTIVGIADVSEHKEEKEILIMPGNLFVVKRIVKDVVTRINKKTLPITEIHLEYLHTPVSFWKKLLHTYRAATKNSVT
jgi:hypothetical protein